MFKNYLKLAIKVLGRKRFFTFVSLFGISFTLMILMLIMAFLDTELGANAPMSRADRMVLVDRLELSTNYFDTIWKLDTNWVAGEKQIDTLGFDTQHAGQSISIDGVGYYVFNSLLADMPEAENMTYLLDRPYDIIEQGQKFQLTAMHSSPSYWDILDFDFLEGRPFNAAEEASAASVMVVTDQMAKEFFGSTQAVVGKQVMLSGRQYEIIGMVARPRASSSFTRADIFLPLSTADGQITDANSLNGPFRAIYLAPNKTGQKALQDALDYAGRQLPIPATEEYENVRIYAFTPEEKYAYNLFNREEIGENRRLFRLTLFGMLGFFILVPTLNLINLNLSRMMERAAEIGVRKSFGASSQQILLQFLFENIVVTFLGGFIGLLLAFGLIALINSSGVLPHAELAFNWRVFGYSFLVCFFFGVLSGLLPAWRMSRLPIIQGLHG